MRVVNEGTRKEGTMSAPLPQKAASRRPRQTAGKRTRHLTEQTRQTGSPGGALMVACILEQAHYKPGDQAPEGYLAWHEWAEVQHKAGLRQKQCGACGLWRYPQELSEHTVRWKGFTARGKAVNQMAPLCLKCEARSKTPNV